MPESQPAVMDAEAEDEAAIAALPIWTGKIRVARLAGGITNRNYTVDCGGRRWVVRVGQDIPLHGILRFNEHAASRAAAACGISPAVRYAAPGFLVLDWIDGVTFAAGDVRRERDRCVALVRRAHAEMPRELHGPLLSFHVFHILRDYLHIVGEAGCVFAGELPRLAECAARLERACGAFVPVFAHNDLLAGNFLDDGKRLWLIDWDYAGFNTPLFDLANLASNNGFGAADDDATLAAYHGRPASDDLRRQLAAMRCASVLREALWSLVQAQYSTLAFDYGAYARDYLDRFEIEWRRFEAFAG